LIYKKLTYNKLTFDFDKNNLKKNILLCSYFSKEGHVPSALSILDILDVLYGRFINLSKLKKQCLDRDYFILSKGHGCLALYSVFLKYGLISSKNLFKFCNKDSILGGHPDSTKLKYIEASTGSLGHGLPFSLGISYAKKIKNLKGNVFTLIGDGECNEGTIWESAMIASHHSLNNLICLIDYNKSTNKFLNIDSLYKKFKSFGWSVDEINGHNKNQIFSSLKKKSNLPRVIICNTIKGKGVNFMENNPEWHHKSLTKEELLKIL